MAIELFGKTREQAYADGFVLTDDDLANYNPAEFFTSTEMVDTVPRLDRVFTEDRLQTLSEGIPVTELPADLGPWPTNLSNYYQVTRSDSSISEASDETGTRRAAGIGPIIPPPPEP